MTHFRRASALSASTLLLALTLTACGGGGGGGGGSSSATATPTSSNSPAGEQPAPPSGAASTPTTTAPGTPAPAASAVEVPTPTDPGSVVTCAPRDAPTARSVTFALVNVVRTALQLPPLTRLPALDATAQAHAQYVVANGVAGSDEISTLPCYTGDTLTQRISAAGVVTVDLPGVRSHTESVLTFDAPAGTEMQTWDIVNGSLDNLYGRTLLLNPFAQHVGVGFSAKPGSSQRAAVFDTVLSADAVAAANAGANTWVVWPRDGAAGLPARMVTSNLKPLDASITEGYPVSLHAMAAVQVTRFILTDASNGAPVTATVVTNANDRNAFLGQGEVALVPHAPLTAGATYRAEFDGLVGTQAVHHSWSFTVR